MALNLTASHTGSTIFDVCVFLNNGAPALATGPAWSNSTAGLGTRGTGAGTPQLQRQNGIWVNAVQITGLNGGSLLIDSSAGQVSAFVTAGQNRKWGVWNAYNRQRIGLLVQDSTSSWTYTGAFRASNNNSANAANVLTGLAEEPVTAIFGQVVGAALNNQGRISVAPNGSAPSGQIGLINGTGAAMTATLGATLLNPPALGSNNYNEYEFGSGASGGQFFGGNLMQMTVEYRG